MTYSIVARDEASGALGVAVQSHYPCVGGVVPWLEPGVGAVATQAMVQPAHGPRGLLRLREGATPDAAIRLLGAEDPDWQIRQVALLDASGATAVHTGEKCIRHAGSRAGAGYCAQGNMLASDSVWDAMGETFEAATGPLARRLLAALDAGEREGGDVRGQQSAALVVVTAHRSDRPWEQKPVDLRVDDHRTPLVELRRLFDLTELYRSSGPEISARVAEGDDAGLEHVLDELRRQMPDNPELLFWAGLSLAGAGRLAQARELLAEAEGHARGWRSLLEALHQAGMLPEDSGLLVRGGEG